MNEMQIFSNPDFGKIRIVDVNGEPWLVGKDVAMVLGYSNPQKAIRDHVDGEDCTVNELFTVNGTQGTLINESGLYSLVLSSKLPTAKRFRRWVTSEVLPSIRRSGSYVLGKKESEQIRLLQELQAELTNWKRLEAQFDAHTTYHRKAYEDARTNRDACRTHIGHLEPVISNLIAQLGNIPMIK